MSKNNNPVNIIAESFVRKGNINDKPMTPRPLTPPQGLSPASNQGQFPTDKEHPNQKPRSPSEK